MTVLYLTEAEYPTHTHPPHAHDPHSHLHSDPLVFCAAQPAQVSWLLLRNHMSVPSLALRLLGFYSSLRLLLVESMYTNSMYDDQPSVWGDLTSSRFISLSFITPTPSHLLSLALVFSVIINKQKKKNSYYNEIPIAPRNIRLKSADDGSH